MKYIYFILIPLLLLSTSNIELSIYKPSNIYSSINSPNTKIEDLEQSHFTIDLKGGSPMKSLPLEIKMNSDEILILNDNNKSKKTPILSDKTSNTFQIVKDVKKSKKPAIDKFILDKKNFDLKFKSLDEMESENINRKSSGIVGFSLGDIDSKKENKFVEQLYQNKLVSNSIFYFDFKEPKLSKNQIISLEDYLNLK